MAVSGIDGAGKGFLASQIAAALRAGGLRAEPINIDGWLNLPHERFRESNPAAHFYEHAIRFDELFGQLVLPLRDARTIRLEADFTEETAAAYRRHVYEYSDLDVILLEGIFLLKRTLVAHYDLSLWIECSFETALERAIARAQEGLSPAETTRAYRTIYFPAQEIHFRRDDPAAHSSMTVANERQAGRRSGDRRWTNRGENSEAPELVLRAASLADDDDHGLGAGRDGAGAPKLL